MKLALSASLFLLGIPLFAMAQTPPASVQGQSITITEGSSGGNLEDRLIFTSSTAGKKVDPVTNDEDPFTYTLTDQGGGTAKLVLQYKIDKWDEFLLTFNPAGGGSFTLKEFDKNALKGTDSGTFTGVTGQPTSLTGVTIETFEAVETETPDRLDFLTANRGRKVEAGDADPFLYTYNVTGLTGATTASAVLTYKPNWKWHEIDFTFTSNTGGTYVQRRFDKNALKDTKTGTFVLAPNTSILDPIASGTYDGVLEIDDVSAVDDDFEGHLRVKLTGGGAFSGKLEIPGRELRFTGVFGADGKYNDTITLADSSILTVALVLEALPTGYKVTGDVTYGGTKYLVDGDQRTFNARRAPCPKAGRYTMILTGDGTPAQTLAIGDGFATVRIDKNGLATLRGRLADGFPLETGVMVRQNGDLTFLVKLYGGKGSLAGRLVFTTVANVSDFNGTLHWTRDSGVVFPKTQPLYSNGFDVDRTAIGSRYSAPGRNQLIVSLPAGPNNLVISFSGAGITPDQTATGTLIPRKDATFSPASGVSLKFNPSDGRFSGSFVDSSATTAVTRKFSGAVLQSQSKGFGYFLGATEGGAVDFGAPVVP
jgi:hypothetical protein